IDQPEVAVDIDGYANWLPGADLQNPANEYEQKGPLRITARLQTASGAASTQTADKFRFELTSVSHEPGVCLNFPPFGQGNTKSDLKFNPLRNPTLTILNNGEATETTQTGLRTASAALSCYDFGAYG